MSDIMIFVNKLYEFSKNYKFDEAEKYITDGLDFLAVTGGYEKIDSILYNLDLNKLNVTIVETLISKTRLYAESLIMRESFMSMAKEQFGKDI